MVNAVRIHQFAPGGAVVDVAAMEQFQKDWRTYQKLVDANALSHQAAGRVLHEALASFRQSFTFVDIACGDASLPKAALAGTRVNHYHGIDLSEPAIELAAANLGSCSFDTDLDHEDYVEALEGRAQAVDVAWCGLSIHHLDTDGKRELLKAIRASTRKFLMLYEPACRDGESRDAFIERFLVTHKPRWTMLSPVEWDHIADHISNCDLPETATGWLELGRDAGFAQARQVFVDPSDSLRIFRYDC
jgi:hypothetical protein